MEERYTVAEARRLRNLSQQDMADKLEMAVSTYRNKESGTSKWYTDEASKVCDILDFEYGRILFGPDVPKK